MQHLVCSNGNLHARESEAVSTFRFLFPFIFARICRRCFVPQYCTVVLASLSLLPSIPRRTAATYSRLSKHMTSSIAQGHTIEQYLLLVPGDWKPHFLQASNSKIMCMSFLLYFRPIRQLPHSRPRSCCRSQPRGANIICSWQWQNCTIFHVTSIRIAGLFHFASRLVRYVISSSPSPGPVVDSSRHKLQSANSRSSVTAHHTWRSQATPTGRLPKS